MAFIHSLLHFVAFAAYSVQDIAAPTNRVSLCESLNSFVTNCAVTSLTALHTQSCTLKGY